MLNLNEIRPGVIGQIYKEFILQFVISNKAQISKWDHPQSKNKAF